MHIQKYFPIFTPTLQASDNNKQMKRQITLVLLAILFCAFHTNNKPPSHLDQMKFKGSIKSVLEVVKVIDSDADNKLVFTTISTFANSGMLYEIKELKNHKLFSKKIYTYSINNELLGYIDYNSDGSIYLKVTYDFNEKGFITAEHFDRSNQKMYNKERQKIDVEYEKIYQNLFTEIVYKCDFKGYKIEEKYLKPDGSLSHKFTYKYDYKYNLLELKQYNSSGKSIKRIKYRYNSNGDTEESKTFFSNRLALTSTFSYEYDSFNNWTKKHERRQVEENIFTEDISRDDVLTERIIKYY